MRRQLSVVERKLEQGRNDGRRHAHRYTMDLPVWYRTVREIAWRAGTIENVSCAGVLIRTDEPTVPRSRVVVVVWLPSMVPGSRAYLIGQGRVVRRTWLSGTTASAFAVRITNYRLERLTHPPNVLALLSTSG